MIDNGISDTVFHILRTKTDNKGPAGYTEDVNIFGTYTNLPAAKEAAKKVLSTEGYEREWFPTYEVKDDYMNEDWKHGDGIMLYAEAPEGEVFKVMIQTEPNLLKIPEMESKDGKVEQSLYYVLQTVINYNLDRSGANRETTIEGTFRHRKEARERASSAVLDGGLTKDGFVEYDEHDGSKDWPWGPGVIIHAVAEGGENYLVSIIKK
jgi:hypothetical protein